MANRNFNMAGRIIIAGLLAFIVIIVESILRSGLTILMTSDIWLIESVVLIGSIITSMIIIATLSRGKVSTFGFKKPDRMHYGRMLLFSFGVGLSASVLQMLLPGEGLTFVDDYSFIQIILFIWIGRSMAEELIFRGLMQSFLSPLAGQGGSIFKVRISLPVFISTLCFALIHLMLLSMGIDNYTVAGIVVFAFILGLMAGYYREKSESLVPAIVIHSIFNISGSIIGFLF
jgi:uncharacterized protein